MTISILDHLFERQLKLTHTIFVIAQFIQISPESVCGSL